MSSGDPLSPCDFSEAFSPPITPGLAPPASEPPSHTLTAPLMSPLTPSALKPTVEVTPYLHPKYLLEEFVLPWKKVVIRHHVTFIYLSGTNLVLFFPIVHLHDIAFDSLAPRHFYESGRRKNYIMRIPLLTIRTGPGTATPNMHIT